MKSKITVIENLIKEGNSYTFSNFSLKRADGETQYGGSDSAEWSTYKIRVNNIVTELMSPDSPAISLVYEGVISRTEGNYNDKFDFVKSNLLKALLLVQNTLEDDIYGELKKESSSSKSPKLSNKIFIVHGHDEAFKTDIERFIHEIGLSPVVLHRQANEGATIIEKFEKHSDVGYAFILLTPDEISYLVDEDKKDDSKRMKEYRARPNVIFEFGYFVGKLGRNRVCCLHKGKVEVPSDIDGLVYKKINGTIESEAYSIIKELKAVGYNINM